MPIIDSTNVTLEWPRPEGRIETYVIRWWPVKNPEDFRTKNVSESNDVSDISFEENSVQIGKVLVSDLMPGVQYFFVVYTVSYDLVSDISNLTTRTSECIDLLRHYDELISSLLFFSQSIWQLINEFCLSTNRHLRFLLSLISSVLSVFLFLLYHLSVKNVLLSDLAISSESWRTMGELRRYHGRSIYN